MTDEELLDDEELIDFFKEAQDKVQEMDGMLIHFGRFYKLYIENPPVAMAIFDCSAW